MQTFIDFLVNNYFWFLIISLILVFALIGYLVDTSEKPSKIKKEVTPIEPTENIMNTQPTQEISNTTVETEMNGNNIEEANMDIPIPTTEIPPKMDMEVLDDLDNLQ